MEKIKIKHKCAGKPLIPVIPGMRAIVEIDGKLVTTSKVVRIKKHTGRKIIFETENSVYEIFFPNHTEAKAV